ncbi:uncharacterized protein LOC122331152 isoform X1 [Puntigrus tetrazona]|uniref:uncharacterized protein LOC122331152 isoform X1 n=1 Tax=Puntigrus tetrazona TaxID=1606681 RepID=UPI001C8A63D2|nr:uncharacterized protein LOC122331152 isoform X1 [Puntigrus tetrazona]
MKSKNTKANLFLIIILAFRIFLSSEASLDDDDDDEVRILAVGVRGQSRFIAADLLSGRRDGGQEDGEIVKTPVITDEAGRTMLVTGPNLCEEDAERQTFTTALFHSTPGPHAVLMVLNLEDQQSGQCDVKKRAQEMLGAEVLQYCIVLLLQNHQEPFTGASGEMINACGGRFHIIRDSEPKPKALIAEINKLVWLNDHRFYSVLNETQLLEFFKRPDEIQKILENDQNVNEGNQVLSVVYNGLGETGAVVGWISLSALVIYSKLNHKYLNSAVKLAALALFMINVRHFLHPDFAIPLNLALVTSFATVLAKDTRDFEEREFIGSQDPRYIIGDVITFLFMKLIFHFIAMMHLPSVVGLSLVFGSIISIRTLSDVLIVCYTAPGVTVGIFSFIFYNEAVSRESPFFALGSFLCSSMGATLSMRLVSMLFSLFGVKMIIILLLFGFTMACLHLKTETLHNVLCYTVIIVVLPCVCVLIGTCVFLLSRLAMSFINVIIEKLVSSWLFYVALWFGSLIAICQRQHASG